MSAESNSRVLELILEGQYLDSSQMGKILGLSTADIEAEIARLTQKRCLLGWRPVLHPEYEGEHQVRAVIEVKMSPEREGGFDRVAERISKFDRVESCYLMSGGYDLMVIVRAENLKRVASFVFEKLATIDGVNGTATHFLLRAYKEQGYLLETTPELEAKPPVSP